MQRLGRAIEAAIRPSDQGFASLFFVELYIDVFITTKCDRDLTLASGYHTYLNDRIFLNTLVKSPVALITISTPVKVGMSDRRRTETQP